MESIWKTFRIVALQLYKKVTLKKIKEAYTSTNSELFMSQNIMGNIHPIAIDNSSYTDIVIGSSSSVQTVVNKSSIDIKLLMSTQVPINHPLKLKLHLLKPSEV